MTQIQAPVLLVQGGEDRVVPPAHAQWLLHRCPKAELWLRPNDGHVSVLDACPVGMDWLLALTEAHGGTAYAENARGGGARLVIDLPVLEPEQS